LPEYNTGVTGFVSVVTRTNELWEIDLYNKGFVPKCNFSLPVLAISSLGTWNAMYAIVNDSAGASFASFDHDTCDLTIISALPYRFDSLFTVGSSLYTSVDLNGTHTMVAAVSSAGVVFNVTVFWCSFGDYCGKFVPQGDVFVSLSLKYGVYTFDAAALPTNENDYAGIHGAFPYGQCPPDTYTTYDRCARYFNFYQPTRYYDYFVHPTAGFLMLGAYEDFPSTGAGDPSVIKVNYTGGSYEAFPLVDIVASPVYVLDGALFFRDRSYCSGNGEFVNNRQCLCDGYALNYGARCENTYPSPVGPPAAPNPQPAAAPMASMSPVAAAPTKPATAPTKPSAPQTVSGGHVVSTSSALFLFLFMTYHLLI
jgi:hypothetical protein